jgi:DinB superfamily
MDQDREREQLALFASGPARLRAALDGLDEAGLDAAPAEGGWSIRQIVHHVVDGDQLWTVGLKAALGDEQVVFELPWYWAISQDSWAERWCYAGRGVAPALDLFEANRQHVVQLMEEIPGAWDRRALVRWPGEEPMPFRAAEVIEMQAGHTLDHTQGIAAIRQAYGL